MSSDPHPLLCPSARSGDDDAVVFGVAEGTATAPMVAYLRHPLPLVEVRHLAGDLEPQEVFRTAAPCAMSACVHFTGSNCSLVTRLVARVEPVVEKPPPCSIRSRCRWWAEQGVAACRRCPQLVTIDFAPTPGLADAARPRATPRAT
jgi:hypothetical protein